MHICLCSCKYVLAVYTDKTSLKADREVWGEGGSRDKRHRGSRDKRHRGTTAPEIHQIHQKTNKSLPGSTRNLQNASRKHQRCSSNSQNNFLIHFARKSSTNPKGTDGRPRSTNRTPEPQRQDHAHRSHSDFPVSSPKPPIPLPPSAPD